jgi:hypothetical protein
MSPDPATLFGPATRAQQKALSARGTKANPAYLPVDVDLVETLVRQASEAVKSCTDVENKHRFVAENILGRHIDKEDPCSA